MALISGLPAWAVGPEDLPSQPKSNVFEILESAISIAALYYPGELSARKSQIISNLDDNIVKARRAPSRNVTIRIRLPETKDHDGHDTEAKLESSKRKLEKGYAAHEVARKRSKVIEFRVGPTKEKAAAVTKAAAEGAHHEETAEAAVTSTEATEVKGSDAKQPTSKQAAGKKKPPPRWWVSLRNERDAARVRNLVHSEVRARNSPAGSLVSSRP